MPKVVYDQTLTRQVEVEVTEEELAILRGNPSDERDAVQDRVLSQALETIDKDKIEPVFALGTCLDENDEELFDVG